MEKINPALVEKYLHNQCSREEALAVMRWFKTPEGQKYLAARIDHGLQQAITHKLDHDIPSEALFQDIIAARDKKVVWPVWYRVAATFIGFLFLFAAYYLVFTHQSSVQYATQYQETKTITLPDGSTVNLNANSTLTYPSNWEENAMREVWLEGEAYFSVTHTADHKKFLVHLDEVTVEVLGTEFNVQDRDGKAQVVLNKGKVRLKAKQANEEKEVVMQPGELVAFARDERTFLKKEVQPESYSSWREGILTFDKATLSEVIAVLENNYGYQVRLENPAMSTLEFTAKVSSHDVVLLLTLLAESFDFNITQQDNTITIKKRPVSQ